VLGDWPARIRWDRRSGSGVVVVPAALHPPLADAAEQQAAQLVRVARPLDGGDLGLPVFLASEEVLDALEVLVADQRFTHAIRSIIHIDSWRWIGHDLIRA
jgi:hypothetical protein